MTVSKSKLRNRERVKKLSFEFDYYDRILEVFSDEECVFKNINGFTLGDFYRAAKPDVKQAAKNHVR